MIQMRIERLDLIAYGMFDGFSLEGLAAPGVHLVYGPNEAGKSTTRAALHELLYGIEHHSRHAFRYGARTRIGARLSTADGVALEITRQKRRRDPLLDGAGTPIKEEALAPFLGGIDRRTFTTEFALDSEELRRGGELLASGSGDLAQLLAAARSGARLNAVLEMIEERKRALYLKTGQKPSINQALKKLQEAKRREDDAVLRPEAYRNAEDAVTAAEEELATVTQRLRDVRRKREERRRLRDSLPALQRLRELEQRIAQITAEGPSAPDDICQALPALLNQRSEHQGTMTVLSDALRTLEQRLGEITAGEELLPHEAEIERLAAELEAVLETVGRQESSSEKAVRIRWEAESLLRKVHPQAHLEDTHLYRIPRGLLDEGRRLRDEGLRHRTELTRAQEDADKWRRKREQADKHLSALPLAEDVSQLKAAYDAVPRDVLTTLSNTEVRLQRQDERFRRQLAELGLPDMAEADVLMLRVPDPRQVELAETEERECAQFEQNLHTDRDRDQRRLAECRRELDKLLSAAAPPTHDELRALREERDRLVGLLPDDPALMPSAVAAVQKADEAADTMLRHARQVEERASLEHEIARLEAGMPRHQSALDDLQRRRTQTRNEWAALWETYPSEPPPVTLAARILERLDQLKSIAEELRDMRIDLDAQRRRLEGHTTRLRRLLRVSDDDPQVTGDTTVSALLAELMEMAATRIEAHHADADKRAEAETELRHAEAQLADAEAAQSAAQQAVTEHERQWRRFLTQANLDENRGYDTAIADLERLLKVAEEVDRAEDVDRAAKLDSLRTAQYARALEATLRACDRPIPSGPDGWRQSVGALVRDLTEQRDAARTREDLQGQRREHQERIDQARAELDRIDSRLASFTERLGLASAAELEAAVERAGELRRQGTALASVKDGLPGGQELETLLDQVEHVTLPELRAEVAELEEDIERLEREQADATRRLAEAQKELSDLNGGADAACAAAEAAHICAGLADEAEEYLRLETARIAILACMEEYRNSDQDSVLARASAVFRELTGGRYSGLGLSDEERPSVRALIGEDTSLAPAELSEGTRDQLYLSLRLATLERHADDGHTLPIAVDDIFMTFDDRRTEAALRVLDAMADRFQVIVFTHHESVVRGAANVLPGNRCHIHRLPH